MAEKEILIQKGDTFQMDVFWGDEDVIVRKPITAISLATGAPRISATAHGMVTGMKAFVTMAEGMTDINHNGPVRLSDMEQVTVIDAGVVEFNGVNPVRDNGRPWPEYTQGGFLCYYNPQSLAGVTALMEITDKLDGTLLASSDAAKAPKNIIDIVVDNANKKFTITILPAKTKALTFKKGVAEFKATTSLGVVKKLKLTSTPDDEPDPVRVANDILP